MKNDSLSLQNNRMTKAEIKLAVLASIVYFVNYLARYDFQASLLSMEGDFGGRALLGIALTVNSVTYAVGQVLTGILGDKIPPRYAVATGLGLTGLCNLLVGLTVNPAIIIAIWGFNGLAQAMIWPSLVRQMAHDMSPYAYSKGIVASSVASSMASVLVYLAIVPISITISSWRIAFFFAFACAAAVGAWWFLSVKVIKPEKTDFSKIVVSETEEKPKNNSAIGLMIVAGVPMLYFMIACHGLLRDGIGDWMPSLMSETFGLEDIASVMSASVIPFVATLAVFMASKLYDIVKSEMKACLILWVVGAGAAFALYFAFNISAVLAVVLLAILAACVHGVNHIATTRLQTHFKSAGLVSTATGLLNSATYVGAAVSGYGIAKFSENNGWQSTVLIWAGVAVLGILSTLLVYKRWTKFSNEHN